MYVLLFTCSIVVPLTANHRDRDGFTWSSSGDIVPTSGTLSRLSTGALGLIRLNCARCCWARMIEPSFVLGSLVHDRIPIL